MDIVTYALSKKYTQKSLDGLGALKGANCTIKSTTPKDNGTEIVFEWTGTSGTIESNTIFVENGVDGIDGNGISNVEKINTIGLIDTYRITFTDGNTFYYSITNGTKGERGLQGLKGDKGEQGEQGVQGVQGVKGEKGDDGYPFLIYKEYSDISEFNKNDFPEIGLMFMIKSDGVASFPVYRYTGNTSTPYSFVTELTGGEGIKGDKGDKGEQGEQGIQGENGKDGTTYTPVIGTVVAGDTASVSVVVDENTSTATFNFVLPKGDKGDNGINGINGTDGITPHIDSATKHWFIGETDTGILAEGTDGATPHIGSNGNWFIDETDTGISAQGKDGKSIKSITKDDNNNIIVTFSDNTTQNIGKLSIDVQADFLTSDGFGKLRYYNGHFQYYDDATSSWIDTSVTPDNVYVMNMAPQPMQAIACKYDKAAGKLKLKFTEPNDTIVDGQAFCIVEKVVIRRKLGSAPTDENDGDFVTEIPRCDFGSYSKTWFVDEGVVPEIGNTYYYKAFPRSTTGFYGYSDLNVAKIMCKAAIIYGFKIDQNESDPASMITYLSDCDNAGFRSAYMDYTADTFNYGDWGDAWFIQDLKPCMLKYDGTVDYELNKDDYTKKADGTASDVANTAYEGNAMIGFPKVYWKVVDNGDDTANVYISDVQIDGSYRCWSHIDYNGNEIEYCYMPIYTGGLVNGKLRSLSGLSPMTNQTRETEINYAKANNLTDDTIWYTEVHSDRTLINLLLLLIGKSTDTQSIFGKGVNQLSIKKSGTLNTKGLFWGDNYDDTGVKVFGMEHIWGNVWRSIAGWINDKGVQKFKMTYGQSDGSTVDGYNLDGTGYVPVTNYTIGNTSDSYLKKMAATEKGLIPIMSGGSSSTYYCDGIWVDNSQINYTLEGGSCSDGLLVGAFAVSLNRSPSFVLSLFGASISCKPLATI